MNEKKLIWCQDRHLLLKIRMWQEHWSTMRCDGTLWHGHRSSWCLFWFPSRSLVLFFYKNRFSELSLRFFIHASFPNNEAGHMTRFPGRLELFWVQVFFSGFGVPLWFYRVNSHWFWYVAHLLMYFVTVLRKLRSSEAAHSRKFNTSWRELE